MTFEKSMKQIFSVRLKRLFSVVAVSLSLLSSTPAMAAIIGMLHESETQRVEFIVQDFSIQIRLTGYENLPSLTLSRYLPSAGGSVRDLLAALQRGEAPPLNSVSGWYSENPGEKKSFKYAIFRPEHSMSFDSPFTGSTVTVPHARAMQTSITQNAQGMNVQTFTTQFRDLNFISSSELLEVYSGATDISLLTQARLPGDFDSSIGAARITSEMVLNGTPVSIESAFAERLNPGIRCQRLFN